MRMRRFLFIVVVFWVFSHASLFGTVPSCCNVDEEQCCCPSVDEICGIPVYLTEYGCVCSEGALLWRKCEYKLENYYVSNCDSYNGDNFYDQQTGYGASGSHGGLLW